MMYSSVYKCRSTHVSFSTFLFSVTNARRFSYTENCTQQKQEAHHSEVSLSSLQRW